MAAIFFFTVIASLTFMVDQRFFVSRTSNRSKHAQITMSLWAKSWNLWQFFNLPRMWFLNSNSSELHINLDLCYMIFYVIPTLFYIFAKWAQLHRDLFLIKPTSEFTTNFSEILPCNFSLFMFSFLVQYQDWILPENIPQRSHIWFPCLEPESN